MAPKGKGECGGLTPRNLYAVSYYAANAGFGLASSAEARDKLGNEERHKQEALSKNKPQVVEKDGCRVKANGWRFEKEWGGSRRRRGV